VNLKCSQRVISGPWSVDRDVGFTLKSGHVQRSRPQADIAVARDNVKLNLPLEIEGHEVLAREPAPVLIGCRWLLRACIGAG
jgi:hypothetical protein